eukprot:3113162-Rhodomonas_salina.2
MPCSLSTFRRYWTRASTHYERPETMTLYNAAARSWYKRSAICYALPGTDAAYGATVLIRRMVVRGVRELAYAATRCAVLVQSVQCYSVSRTGPRMVL